MTYGGETRNSPYAPLSPEGTGALRPIDPQSVEQLFRDHNDSLIRFLLLRLRSYQEAREVAQEAYVRLLSLHEPGTVSYLKAFLFRTAANIAVDRQRREEIHAQASKLPVFHEFTDARTPERAVAGAQDIERLEVWLRQLPPRCRQAFVLNRFYGKDFVEIGETLRVSERTARVYVEQALVYCREMMEKETRHG